MTDTKKLSWLLRLAGATCLLAVFPAAMPLDWMHWAHRLTGMGPMPNGPVVEYLARSTSALYAFVGGLMVVFGSDVRRYEVPIRFTGRAWLLLGVGITMADMYASMPWWWTWSEGPITVGMGLVILVLLARAIREPHKDAP